MWRKNIGATLIDVEVPYGAGTDCATCSLTVTSNEPENGLGDGDTAPNYEVVDAHHVRLRAGDARAMIFFHAPMIFHRSRGL